MGEGEGGRGRDTERGRDVSNSVTPGLEAVVLSVNYITQLENYCSRDVNPRVNLTIYGIYVVTNEITVIMLL